MITVFTPSYNRKKELKDLYESLKKQTNKDFEWLIVDDGSSDNTDKYILNVRWFLRTIGLNPILSAICQVYR